MMISDKCIDFSRVHCSGSELKHLILLFHLQCNYDYDFAPP